MATCEQCTREFEAKRADARFCSAKCRVTANRQSVTDNSLVAECQRRARQGLSWRKGDPVWPYTRHLTPIDFVLWCRQFKPSWLTSAVPGDPDYTEPKGHCRTCGVETQTEGIVKCYQCVFGKEAAA